MQIEKLIQEIVDFLPGLAVEEKDTKFVTLGALKAMMLLSAVDGDISRQEMKTFWDHAQHCKDIEKACIGELVRIVREKWEIDVAVRAAHL